jgi:hypothetical protein
MRQQKVNLWRPEVSERSVCPHRIVLQINGAQQAAV